MHTGMQFNLIMHTEIIIITHGIKSYCSHELEELHSTIISFLRQGYLSWEVKKKVSNPQRNNHKQNNINDIKCELYCIKENWIEHVVTNVWRDTVFTQASGVSLFASSTDRGSTGVVACALVTVWFRLSDELLTVELTSVVSRFLLANLGLDTVAAVAVRHNGKKKLELALSSVCI